VAGEVQVEATRVGLVVRSPEPAELAVLFLHDDRRFSGSPEIALDTAGQLSLRTGATVVCARYRPSFPSSLEDVQAAYHYSQAIGPVMLAAAGVGGGLAAALMIRLRDSGAALPGCAALASPLLDLSLQAQSLLFNAGANPSFDLDELRHRVERYTGGANPADPLVSPLHGNLHGLPPIQLLTAGTDPLLDDSLAFAARAARSSVAVEIGRAHV
jgi:monoterpene epsilon-lactone hydrolase